MYFQERIKIKLIAYGVGLYLLQSCVNVTNPELPWFEPIDLSLNGDELAGVKIEVGCGIGIEGKDAWRSRRLRACTQIVDILNEYGADVIEEDEYAEDSTEDNHGKQEKDFSLIYIERFPASVLAFDSEDEGYQDFEGESRDDSNSIFIKYGTSLWLCLPTFTFIPCQQDFDAHAELSFYDNQGFLKKTLHLRATFTEYAGIGALYVYIVKRFNKDVNDYYKQIIPGRLREYILNSVVTYNVRRQLVMKQQ